MRRFWSAQVPQNTLPWPLRRVSMLVAACRFSIVAADTMSAKVSKTTLTRNFVAICELMELQVARARQMKNVPSWTLKILLYSTFPFLAAGVFVVLPVNIPRFSGCQALGLEDQYQLHWKGKRSGLRRMKPLGHTRNCSARTRSSPSMVLLRKTG